MLHFHFCTTGHISEIQAIKNSDNTLVQLFLQIATDCLALESINETVKDLCHRRLIVLA